jgi:group I intron endonuclease
MKKRSGVYLIRNVASGRVYVGSTVNEFAKRWKDHARKLARGDHDNPAMQRAWKKHGEEAFRFEEIESGLPRSLVRSREQFWIDALDSYRRGYNCRARVETQYGFKASAATRKRQSAMAKLRVEWQGVQGIAAQSGWRHTAETRAKMSASRAGAPKSHEWRARIGESQRGKVLTPEHREKLSAAAKRRCERKREQAT